jgi:hypothetical protein
MRGDLTLIYFARCLDGTVKIGSTIDGHARRIQLNKLRPEFLFGFYASQEDGGSAIERVFHRHFALKRVGISEQFRLTGADLLEARLLPLWRCGGQAFCECHGLTRHRAFSGWQQQTRNRVFMVRVTPKLHSQTWERMPSVAHLSVQ